MRILDTYKPRTYTYRQVRGRDGKTYYLPDDIGTDKHRASFWLYWQRPGLKIPDPETGLCGFWQQPNRHQNVTSNHDLADSQQTVSKQSPDSEAREIPPARPLVSSIEHNHDLAAAMEQQAIYEGVA